MRKLLWMLLLPMVFAGCEKQPTVTPTSAAAPWSGKMSFSTEPSPPVVNKDTILHLKLMDEAGRPVPDATVKASLKMNTMDMGKNELSLAAKGGGEYAGAGKFAMTGPWTVNVDVRLDGKSGGQSFPVVVHRE